LDATDALLNKLASWSFDVVILGGATFAGFNVIDVENVYNKKRVPMIVYMSHKPDMSATLRALRKHFPDWELRWERFLALGELHELVIDDNPPIYYEIIGASTSFAEQVLREQAIQGRTPEAVRVANLIAKGVSSVFRDPMGSRYGS
jgi:hypothetical protein